VSSDIRIETIFMRGGGEPDVIGARIVH
jgi:hypothetical protein